MTWGSFRRTARVRMLLLECDVALSARIHSPLSSLSHSFAPMVSSLQMYSRCAYVS
jgi:hypothetical protein